MELSSVNVRCISVNRHEPEEEWEFEEVPTYYDMDSRLLSTPSLWELAPLESQLAEVTGEEEEEEVVGEALTAVGIEEEGEVLIAAGMEELALEDDNYDYHHAETTERCGENYSLEEYFETIAFSHPGYACHRRELPKAVFRK